MRHKSLAATLVCASFIVATSSFAQSTQIKDVERRITNVSDDDAPDSAQATRRIAPNVKTYSASGSRHAAPHGTIGGQQTNVGNSNLSQSSNVSRSTTNCVNGQCTTQTQASSSDSTGSGGRAAGTATTKRAAQGSTPRDVNAAEEQALEGTPLQGASPEMYESHARSQAQQALDNVPKLVEPK